MRRRDFIRLIGGVTMASPLAARAQQRVRRIGFLANAGETDRTREALRTILRAELEKLGWIEGRNVRLDLRFSGRDPDRLRAYADELVRSAPDIIGVTGSAATRTLLQRTRTIPIVFTSVGDPVAGGFLKNIASPEGNVTGATNLPTSLGGKWLELLKEAAPRTARVALVFSPEFANQTFFATFDAAAEALGIRTVRMSYHSARELEQLLDAFAAEANGGVLMVPPPAAESIHELINRLALKHHLPTISAYKTVTAEGSLMSYGPDNREPYQIAVAYIDRILRGTKVSELPVQFPSKYELVINLKTARALGLDIPWFLQQRADEVIE